MHKSCQSSQIWLAELTAVISHAEIGKFYCTILGDENVFKSDVVVGDA